jgi:hypothetical protein
MARREEHDGLKLPSPRALPRERRMTTAGANTAQTPRVEAPPNVTAQAVSTEDLPCPPGSLDGRMWRLHTPTPVWSPSMPTGWRGVHAGVTREPLGHLHPFLDPESYGTEGEGTPLHRLREGARWRGTGGGSGGPAAPPSVVNSGSLMSDGTHRACNAGAQGFSPLDPQLGPEILEQTGD